MQQPSPSEETAALLARLSQRPGVQSTLILSRSTGAIVRSTGLLTAEDISEEGETAPNGIGGTDTEGQKKGTRNADAVARLVWNFVKSAGQTTEELNGEGDEVKLLRLRTRKNELVIVPDAKFFLPLPLTRTALPLPNNSTPLPTRSPIKSSRRRDVAVSGRARW